MSCVISGSSSIATISNKASTPGTNFHTIVPLGMCCPANRPKPSISLGARIALTSNIISYRPCVRSAVRSRTSVVISRPRKSADISARIRTLYRSWFSAVNRTCRNSVGAFMSLRMLARAIPAGRHCVKKRFVPPTIPLWLMQTWLTRFREAQNRPIFAKNSLFWVRF
jgi:hypothetical protein